MTTHHDREHALLGIVARDPAFAAVAARQRALLDDAAAARRRTGGREVRRRPRRLPLPRLRLRRTEKSTP